MLWPFLFLCGGNLQLDTPLGCSLEEAFQDNYSNPGNTVGGAQSSKIRWESVAPAELATK
jgi:hypothetical protein